MLAGAIQGNEYMLKSLPFSSTKILYILEFSLGTRETQNILVKIEVLPMQEVNRFQLVPSKQGIHKKMCLNSICSEKCLKFERYVSNMIWSFIKMGLGEPSQIQYGRLICVYSYAFVCCGLTKMQLLALMSSKPQEDCWKNIGQM